MRMAMKSAEEISLHGSWRNAHTWGEKRKNTTLPFPSPGFSLLFQVKWGKRSPKKGVLLDQVLCWTNMLIESKEGTTWLHSSHLLTFVSPDQRKTHWWLRLEKSVFFSRSLYYGLLGKVYWDGQDGEGRLTFLSQNAFWSGAKWWMLRMPKVGIKVEKPDAVDMIC